MKERITGSNFKHQLDEIRRAGRERDYQKAIRLCGRLLSETDKHPEALLYLGRSYHEIKLYDKALHAFLFFKSRKPDSPLGNFFLGRTYAALGMYPEAIGPLEAVLQKHPQFSPALSFLGIAHLKMRRPDAAIGYFEKAVQSDPRNSRIHNAYLNALLVQGIRLFYRKDLEHAARVFEFLVEERTGDIVPVVYLAAIAREFGNFALALHYYDLALKISPDDPVFHLHKAYLLLQTGREAEALAELGRAKDLLPEDLPGTSDPNNLLKLISITHFRNKRYREAIYFGKQVLKRDYRDPDMHMLLAECYRYYGDLKKAANHYRRAFENDPTRPEISGGLAVVLWETAQYDELLALTARMERLRSGDRLAGYFRVLCRSELGDSPHELIPLLQEEIRLHGPDPHLMWNLAHCYARSGRDDLAESWLVRTLRLVANHRRALLLLQRVYERLGRVSDEIATLKSILKFYPAQPRFMHKYAKLLLRERRYKEAAACLEKLVTLKPGNTALKKTLGLVLIKDNNYSDALIVFKELILQDPQSVFFLRQFIYCVVKMKNLSTALLILEKAVRYIPEKTELLLPLGVLYGRLRQFERSAGIFRAVIGIRPKDWRAYHNLAMLYKRMGNHGLFSNFLEKAIALRKEQATSGTAGENASRRRKSGTPKGRRKRII